MILGATLNEDGGITFSTVSGVAAGERSGIVNKLQDPDGVTRRALTYLVSGNPASPQSRFFSWELKLLEAVKQLPLLALEDRGREVVLRRPGQPWRIPVDPVTKAFLIRYRAHTVDFQRLSFHEVLAGDFDPRLVADKIVLIGFLSELFQDIHRTPIGWLPGVTLNANAFLTLYTQDFLRPLPEGIEAAAAALWMTLGILVTFGVRRRALAALGLGLLVAAFFAASALLYPLGYTWNYVRLPAGLLVVPGLLRWGSNCLAGRRRRKKP